MYLPEAFEEQRTEVLHGLIAANPLGALVTIQDGVLTADHIPFLLDPREGENGRLIGHVARNNPLWRDHEPAIDVLVVFQASSAYISPSWYPTKLETHEVVPTWNYATVHINGPLLLHEDAKWLLGVVGRLSTVMERGRVDPWKMADAPRAYIDNQLGQIVGIEIPISRLTGKWKMSQNRPLADRRGAIDGLRARGSARECEVADTIESLLP